MHRRPRVRTDVGLRRKLRDATRELSGETCNEAGAEVARASEGDVSTAENLTDWTPADRRARRSCRRPQLLISIALVSARRLPRRLQSPTESDPLSAAAPAGVTVPTGRHARTAPHCARGRFLLPRVSDLFFVMADSSCSHSLLELQAGLAICSCFGLKHQGVYVVIVAPELRGARSRHTTEHVHRHLPDTAVLGILGCP
eukprot:9487124-Pyramimonas_sp.AAC.3